MPTRRRQPAAARGGHAGRCAGTSTSRQALHSMSLLNATMSGYTKLRRNKLVLQHQPQTTPAALPSGGPRSGSAAALLCIPAGSAAAHAARTARQRAPEVGAHDNRTGGTAAAAQRQGNSTGRRCSEPSGAQGSPGGSGGGAAGAACRAWAGQAAFRRSWAASLPQQHMDAGNSSSRGGCTGWRAANHGACRASGGGGSAASNGQASSSIQADGCHTQARRRRWQQKSGDGAERCGGAAAPAGIQDRQGRQEPAAHGCQVGGTRQPHVAQP